MRALMYGAREVARVVGLSVVQVRSFVKAGFLEARRGPRGELRFSFQDLVLLRAAKGLVTAKVPPRRVKRALARLKEQLPPDRPLRSLTIAADGDHVVVSDGTARWRPESGQVLFDFAVAELAREAAPIALAHVREEREAERDAANLDAGFWFDRATDLEDAAPEEARAAYEHALALDPRHADALVNLGRLVHEAGDHARAAELYRRAAAARPDDATARFNLGVALEDLARPDEAAAAYERALALDPRCADAHYNLAQLSERAGKASMALTHFNAYRRLTRDR